MLMKETWLDHPWSKTGMVELIPTEILALIANQNPTDTTDNLDGSIHHVDRIWESVLKNGMRDPLLIVLNKKEKSIRLESGNHRVYQALNSGLPKLPVATFVMPEPIFHKGSGEHFYRAENIISYEDLLLQPYPYQIKIEDVIKSDFIDFDLSDWNSNLLAQQTE